MKRINEIVEPEIALVHAPQAQQALRNAYRDCTESLRRIEDFFDAFSSMAWHPDARRIFFHNWRSPGIGSASFCALAFRVLEQAEHASQDRQVLLLRTAARVSEVSREDVGIGTTNHQLLYDRFATGLTGDDQWRLDRYRMPGAKAYLNASRRYRENGEDLGVAIIRSLPEELYNHGEFAYATPCFVAWRRDRLGRGQEGIKEDLQFLHDHLGTTESGHFAALVRGMEDYFAAAQREPDWQLLYQASRQLIENMATHYDLLMQHMQAAHTRSELEAVA
ncbi:hypothetical protein LL967_07735 [Xanthomonas campestris pv. zinniae]|nr:hypothetical protein [Xanthomonas campestris pv. zinniae]